MGARATFVSRPAPNAWGQIAKANAQEGELLGATHTNQGRIMPNTRNVIDNNETISHEWNGVKLFSLSRSRERLAGESKIQYRARLERARAIQRQNMAARRQVGTKAGQGLDHTTSQGHSAGEVPASAKDDRSVVAQDAETVSDFATGYAHGELGRDRAAEAGDSEVPVVIGDVISGDCYENAAIAEESAKDVIVFPAPVDTNFSPGRSGALGGVLFSPPFRGGEKQHHPDQRPVASGGGGESGMTANQNPTASPTLEHIAAHDNQKPSTVAAGANRDHGAVADGSQGPQQAQHGIVAAQTGRGSLEASGGHQGPFAAKQSTVAVFLDRDHATGAGSHQEPPPANHFVPASAAEMMALKLEVKETARRLADAEMTIREQARRILDIEINDARGKWVETHFSELLARLGTVEQIVSSPQPPRKPWLPQLPPPINDRMIAAHNAREEMSEVARARLDHEEGRWPYCAWHLVLGQVRNNGNLMTTVMDPRDKLALDRLAYMSMEVCFDDDVRGADLLYYWFQRFLSQDTESLEGQSLVDKFYRCVLRGEMPKRLPESLCPWWPRSAEEANRSYQPIWPSDEIEFQWNQEREYFYQERGRRVARLEEEHRQKQAEAMELRRVAEQEARAEFERKRAERDADLLANGWSK